MTYLEEVTVKTMPKFYDICIDKYSRGIYLREDF